MEDFKMLLTGDYWHADFQALTREFHNEIKLVPPGDFFELGELDSNCSLIVIAQSRRNQFDRKRIEWLFSAYPHIPLIALSGSWCEGESRSGSPVPGMIRVYWHQWRGRLGSFRRQLENLQIATWQLPKTLSSADRVLRDLPCAQIETDDRPLIGISALTPNSFGMFQDACNAAEFDMVWIETVGEEEVGEHVPELILLDGNSMSQHFVKRVRNVRRLYPASVMIAALNFPRQYDFVVAQQEGIVDVVSKPFHLSDLHLLMAAPD